MSQTVSQLQFDPECAATLALLNEVVPPTLTSDMITARRENFSALAAETQAALAEAGIAWRDVTIPGHRGDDIRATVFHREGHRGTSPGIYHLHGGGMVMGDRFVGIRSVIPWIIRFDVVVVSLEYRLAPEFPDPYPVQDCYAGLVWVADHARELGIDPERLIIEGGSAGGGLAAGTALLARDRGGPRLAGQVLGCPMLDDRDLTVSSAQVDGIGVWDRTSNRTGWTALLGDRCGGRDVSIYAAPARATDLSGLPPAFLDCGSVEVFRDEIVMYASSLWRDGVQAELHVWPGGFHGFGELAPHVPLAKASRTAREEWVARLLGA